MANIRPPEPWAQELDALLIPVAALGVVAERAAEHLTSQITGGQAVGLAAKGLRSRLCSTFYRRAVEAYLLSRSPQDVVVVPSAGGRAPLYFLRGHQLLLSLRYPPLRPEHRYRGIGDKFDRAKGDAHQGAASGVVLDRAVICLAGVQGEGRLVSARIFSPRGARETHWDYTIAPEEIAAWLASYSRGPDIPECLREIDRVLALRLNQRIFQVGGIAGGGSQAKEGPLRFPTPPPPASRRVDRPDIASNSMEA